MPNKQYLVDAATRHQVFLQRYAGTESKQMLTFLKSVMKEAEILLSQSNTITSKARLDTIVRDMKNLTKAIYNDMAKDVKSRMVDLAKYESDFTARLLQQGVDFPRIDGDINKEFAFNSPSVQQLKSAAFTTIMDANPGYRGTVTVGDALLKFGTNKAGDMAKAVRVGFALGKTNKEIANDLRKTLNKVTANQADSLARTITNHVASTSRKEFYDANSSILVDYCTIVATLDGRTTLTCISLDGKTEKAKDFVPPPYHWRCRTTFIREVKDEYKLDIKGVSRTAKGANGVENVSSKTDYNSWLKTQPAKFQDEVLGPNRAELFRKGMDVDKFVDKNYQPITLKDLKNKDNEHIFTKAGL